jgi:hypothetical protein
VNTAIPSLQGLAKNNRLARPGFSENALFALRDSGYGCLLSEIHLVVANVVDYSIFCYATLRRG